MSIYLFLAFINSFMLIFPMEKVPSSPFSLKPTQIVHKLIEEQKKKIEEERLPGESSSSSMLKTYEELYPYYEKNVETFKAKTYEVAGDISYGMDLTEIKNIITKNSKRCISKAPFLPKKSSAHYQKKSCLPKEII